MKQLCKKESNYNSLLDNVSVNRTAIVDTKFGNNETARLEDLSYPFKTIKAAFKAIKNNRLSVSESWNVIVRLGVYKLDVPIPNKIILVGAGQETILYGKLKIRGHAEIIALSVVSDELPIIEVNTKQKYKNAIVLLTGLDVFTTKNFNSLKSDKNVVRVAIRINSNAINSTIVIKDCRFTFLFDRLNLGENKFILVSNARLNILTSIIRASGSSAVRNSIVENTNGSIDVELGAILFTSSSNQLSKYIAFYVNSSSNPMLINSNRILYTAKNIVSNQMSNSGIPNAVIYALAKDQGIIFSRFALVDIQNVLPENFIVAFTASLTAKISVLEFSTLNDFTGEIGGFPETTKPNIIYQLSANGNTLQSGSSSLGVVQISPGDPSPYLVKKEDAFINVASGVMNGFIIQFPNPINTDIKLGQVFQISFGNSSIRIIATPFDKIIPATNVNIYVQLTLTDTFITWGITTSGPPP